jgi:LysM repeat protein
MSKKKVISRLYTKFITSTVLGTILLVSSQPGMTSADIASLLSSVFQNKTITKVQEIEISGGLQAKNLQNMSVLYAPLSPQNQASTTEDSKNTFKYIASISEGKALTNENSSLGESSALSEKDITSDQISLYSVRNGDKIEQIAKMYGVNASTILWANDLKKGTTLVQDQVLVILPISGIKYTVKKGDNLASIAQKYKSEVSEIAQFNNIEEDISLGVGDTVIIPDAEGSLAEAESKKEIDAKKKKEKDKKLDNKTIGNSSGSNSNGSKVDTTGYFMRPIIGGVKTQGIHGHNGVDLASSYGSSILAAAAGKVVVAKVGGWGGGYGNYIVVQHANGTQTLYAHLSEVLVQTGDSVSKGQTIGKMGSTGRSTGIHLHFEVRGGRNPF